MRLQKSETHGWRFTSRLLVVVDRAALHPHSLNTYEMVWRRGKKGQYGPVLIIGTKRVGVNVHFIRPWLTRQQKAMRARLLGAA